MNKPAKNDPAQMTFPDVICPVTAIKVGENTWRYELGKPLQWLSPLQFAREMGGVDRQSVYRWISEGTLPDKAVGKDDGKEIVLWELKGARGYRISAAAVGWLKAKFRNEKDAAKN